MNFKLGLDKPRGVPKYITAGHFGLWQLAMSWECSASPSKLNSEALDACTLTRPINYCCWVILFWANGCLQVGLGVPVSSIPLAMLTICICWSVKQKWDTMCSIQEVQRSEFDHS